MNGPSPYRTAPRSPGKLSWAGTSARHTGIDSASLPEGSTSPSRSWAAAAPPAWPPSHSSRTASASGSQSATVTVEPLESTTTTFAATSRTAWSSVTWDSGRSMWARS